MVQILKDNSETVEQFIERQVSYYRERNRDSVRAFWEMANGTNWLDYIKDGTICKPINELVKEALGTSGLVTEWDLAQFLLLKYDGLSISEEVVTNYYVTRSRK